MESKEERAKNIKRREQVDESKRQNGILRSPFEIVFAFELLMRGWGRDSYSNWIMRRVEGKQAGTSSISFAWSIPHVNHREWRKKGGWSDKKKNNNKKTRERQAKPRARKNATNNTARESELNHSQHRGADVNAAPLTRTLAECIAMTQILELTLNTWKELS